MHVLLICPAGIDYTAVITTLTFSVSMPTQVVTIPILDDEIVESSKSFMVTLTTTDQAVTLNVQTASVTIGGTILSHLQLHATLIFNSFSRGYNRI